MESKIQTIVYTICRVTIHVLQIRIKNGNALLFLTKATRRYKTNQ